MFNLDTFNDRTDFLCKSLISVSSILCYPLTLSCTYHMHICVTQQQTWVSMWESIQGTWAVMLRGIKSWLWTSVESQKGEQDLTVSNYSTLTWVLADSILSHTLTLSLSLSPLSPPSPLPSLPSSLFLQWWKSFPNHGHYQGEYRMQLSMTVCGTVDYVWLGNVWVTYCVSIVWYPVMAQGIDILTVPSLHTYNLSLP